MADSAMKFKGGDFPAPGAAGEGAGAPAAAASSAPAEFKSIADIVSLCTSPSVLSKEGEAYIDKIVDTLRGSGREAKAHKIVGANYEARVIECGDSLNTFVFAETYQSNADPQPIAGCHRDLRNAMRAVGLDYEKVDQLIVVTREDYEKVDIMAAYIVNSYLASDTKQVRELSAASFQNGTFRVTTDQEVVRQYVEKTYPLKTLPRGDVKLLLYTVKPIENSFAPDGRPEMQRIPILADTAYTDFEYYTQTYAYMQNTMKYSPLLVLTGTHSKLNCEKIAVIGTVLARYLFISQGRWLEQFSTFQKGSPDIGMLVLDDKLRPAHAANITDRNLAIERVLSSRIPKMAIDLQLGAPIMSGLKNIIKNPAVFNTAVDRFTGGEGATKAGVPYQLLAIRFDGRVRLSKSGVTDYVDTRCVDYLHLLQSGAELKEVTDMLQPTYEPKLKGDVLKRYYPEAQLLYITHRLTMNPVWVDAVMNDVGASLKVQVEGAFAPNTYDVSQLADFQLGNTSMFFSPTGGSPYSVGFF